MLGYTPSPALGSRGIRRSRPLTQHARSLVARERPLQGKRMIPFGTSLFTGEIPAVATGDAAAGAVTIGVPVGLGSSGSAQHTRHRMKVSVTAAQRAVRLCHRWFPKRTEMISRTGGGGSRALG